jgi:hypothetical protein
MPPAAERLSDSETVLARFVNVRPGSVHRDSVWTTSVLNSDTYDGTNDSAIPRLMVQGDAAPRKTTETAVVYIGVSMRRSVKIRSRYSLKRLATWTISVIKLLERKKVGD